MAEAANAYPRRHPAADAAETQRQQRNAAIAARREETIDRYAQVQTRLRAEAQARREAKAASTPTPPPRGHR